MGADAKTNLSLCGHKTDGSPHTYMERKNQGTGNAERFSGQSGDARGCGMCKGLTAVWAGPGGVYPVGAAAGGFGAAAALGAWALDVRPDINAESAAEEEQRRGRRGGQDQNAAQDQGLAGVIWARRSRVDFEEYVACVTASEMPNTFEPEALKAQSARGPSRCQKKNTRSKSRSSIQRRRSATQRIVRSIRRKKRADRLSRGWLQGTDQKTGWPKVRQRAEEHRKGSCCIRRQAGDAAAVLLIERRADRETPRDVFVSARMLVSVIWPLYEEKATHRNEQNTTFTFRNGTGFQRDFGKLTRKNVKILSPYRRPTWRRWSRTRVLEKCAGTQRAQASSFSAVFHQL